MEQGSVTGTPGAKQPLTREEKGLVALLPVGSTVLVIGIVLLVLFHGAADWAGGSLIAAGLTIELIALLGLLKARKDRG